MDLGISSDFVVVDRHPTCHIIASGHHTSIVLKHKPKSLGGFFNLLEEHNHLIATEHHNVDWLVSKIIYTQMN